MLVENLSSGMQSQVNGHQQKQRQWNESCLGGSQ